MERSLYLRRGTTVLGPFTFTKLQEDVQADSLFESDLLSESETGPWAEASQIDGLSFPTKGNSTENDGENTECSDDVHVPFSFPLEHPDVKDVNKKQELTTKPTSPKTLTSKTPEAEQSAAQEASTTPDATSADRFAVVGVITIIFVAGMTLLSMVTDSTHKRLHTREAIDGQNGGSIPPSPDQMNEKPEDQLFLDRVPPRPVTGNRSPTYPPALLAQKISGRVVLLVSVFKDGLVGKISVDESSGHNEFDKAAMTAVTFWRFSPGTQGGNIQQMDVLVPVTFRISNPQEKLDELRDAEEKDAKEKLTQEKLAQENEAKEKLAEGKLDLGKLDLEKPAREIEADYRAAILDLDPIRNTVGMRLKLIPAGTFRMGTVRKFVTIRKAFYMQTTEVTQAKWELVMGTKPWQKQPKQNLENIMQYPSYPAVFLTWDNAVEFCKKLSGREGKTYRLPTETEWEYACSAGTNTKWSFGNAEVMLEDYAWYLTNSNFTGSQYARKVELLKPNPFGLYDMHGNTSEWCSDRIANKTGGFDAVMRGGSWAHKASKTTSTYREHVQTNVPSSYYGFRVVRELD